MKAFMKFYLPFRRVFFSIGTLPGIFISWPLLFIIFAVIPDYIGDPVGTAIGDGMWWVVDGAVSMFANPEDHPKLRFWLLIMLPSFIVYSIVLLENVTGFYVHIEEASGKREAREVLK